MGDGLASHTGADLLKLLFHSVAECNDPALPSYKVSGERDVKEMLLVRNYVVCNGNRPEIFPALLFQDSGNLSAHASKRRGKVAHPVSCQQDIRFESGYGPGCGRIGQRIGRIQNSNAFYRAGIVILGNFLGLSWKEDAGILPFEVERLNCVLL